MKFKLFNKYLSDMYIIHGGVKFTLQKYDNTILEYIADYLGLNQINVKHYLLTGDKELKEKLKNSKLQAGNFPTIIEGFKMDTLKTAIYNTGNIVLKSQNKIYKLIIDGKKLIFIMTV